MGWRTSHATHDRCEPGSVVVYSCSDECSFADVAECEVCGELFVFQCPVHHVPTTP